MLCYLVPTPSVSVTTPNTQIVGLVAILECSVTAVRGITSRVDIIWSRDDVVLNRTNNTSPTMTDNSLIYTDTYTISLLTTTDDGREYECTVVINASPEVTATGSITLDVMGRCTFPESVMHVCIFVCSSYSYSHHITVWCNTRSYGG